MSFEDGWKAVNLDMPDRIPRFDPSAAEYHWDLVNRVCGTALTVDSSRSDQLEGTKAFLKAWDYGIYPAPHVAGGELAAKHTSMGHAGYAQHGRDFNDNLQCPFTDVEEVFAFDPWDTYGARDKEHLIKRFNDHYAGQCEQFQNVVNTTGVYVTLMSGMIDIFGWDMLLTAAGIDSDRFGEVVNRYAHWIFQFYDAIAMCDAAVIYSHDDLVWTEGAFINPAWYRKYIFPNLEMLWHPLRKAGKKIQFVCDGNYTAFLSDIAACGNHGFWFECFTDLEAICRSFGKTHFIVGNGDARVLTFGTKEEIRIEVLRCMDAGRDCPGYFMCISGHIPPNVPVENALYYNDVYMAERERR